MEIKKVEIKSQNCLFTLYLTPGFYGPDIICPLSSIIVKAEAQFFDTIARRCLLTEVLKICQVYPVTACVFKQYILTLFVSQNSAIAVKFCFRLDFYCGCEISSSEIRYVINFT